MPTAALAAARNELTPLLERKRMIDGAWVVCVLVVLGAVSFLWFLRVLDVDLTRVAGWVLAYTVVHLLVATFSDRLTSSTAVAASLRATILSSVVFLAFFWHLVGGLKHPMFLAVFTLPVIMSGILLMDWQAHATAAASVVLVVFVALAESADLRWYVGRLHAPWVARVASAAASLLPAVQVFPGMETGPAYEFSLVVTFAAVQFTVAFLSGPLALVLVRINSRLAVSAKLLTEVQGLFHAVLRAEPEPSVIVYADSFQLVQASDSFFKRMLVRPSELAGKALFEVIDFAQPDVVRAALNEQSGELPFCVYHLRGETRIANLSFYRTDHQGQKYVYMAWQELTDLYYLETAFDAIEDPLLVLGGNSRLHYVNRHARHMFGDLHFGMDATTVPKLAQLLADLDRANDNIADAGRHVIDGQPYDVHSFAPQMSGEGEPCTILWLHCVAREEALFEQAVKDPLTGAYNRRYFDDVLARHVATTSKLGRQLSCAYFDLDNFKPINDRFGHAAGDAALLAFVRAVKSQLRAVDIFARLGGDEFAVLFVNCDAEVAGGIIHRIRAILTKDGWTHEGQRGELTFSAGLAASHPDDDVETLLKRTDKAVYAAKAAGKGRTAVET